MHIKIRHLVNMLTVLAITTGSYINAGAKPEVELTGPIAVATTYYVSTTGNDANPGTSAAPFRTITRGVSALGSGDILQVYGGTYSEEVTISRSGTSSAPITVRPVSGQQVIVDGGLARGRGFTLSGSYIVIEGFHVQRALEFCVDITGTNITVRGFSIHDCHRVGLRVKNRNVTVENSNLYNNVLSDRGTTATSGWSAALRVSLGSENVTLRNNSVYNNWGEGIAIGQGKNIHILNNTVHDNFSQNIYINNSMDVNVDGNFVYSTNPTYYRNGQPANGIGLAEEFFDGWGAQLARIRVVNNIVAFCRRGIGYTYAEVQGGLDSSTIAFNTIWGSTEMGILVINQPTKTRNSVIANNIVQQPNGKLADIQVTSGVSLHHNFWVSPVSVLNHASGSGDRTGDVMLPGTPTAATPQSFRLHYYSPAREGGSPGLDVTRDFEGKSRSQSPDMGAIEYGGPGIAGLRSPSGNLGTNFQPTYRWSPVAGSTWYYLWVDGPSGVVFNEWYRSNDICGSGTCSITPEMNLGGGSYTWWVQTWSDGGYGPWSSGMSFQVDVPRPPGAANLTSPSGNIGSNFQPTYKWNEVSGSTWYYLWVNGPSGVVHNTWYQSTNICSGGVCSVTPNVTLNAVSHTWWVQTWNPGGYGPWSSGMTFQFDVPRPPSAATLLSPSGNIGSNFDPTYRWNEVAGSTWYYLWVNGPSGAVHNTWYRAADICSGGTCSIMPNITLQDGSHMWWVQTWNENGYGPWSTGMTFTILSGSASAPDASATATLEESAATPTLDLTSESTTYDDNDAALTYSSNWTENENAEAYGGSFKKSVGIGSTVTITFFGTSFSLLYTTNSTFGNMDVIVDGVKVGTINQNSSSRRFNLTWSLPTSLPAATHTLLLKHTGPSSTRITLDAITVYP